ncbi:Spermatoproteinsis-associated serine-rich protein 1 [Sparganum proliferum]
MYCPFQVSAVAKVCEDACEHYAHMSFVHTANTRHRRTLEPFGFIPVTCFCAHSQLVVFILLLNEADLKLQNAVAATATGLPPADLHDTELTLGDKPLICGPDWISQLRHIKPYQNEGQKDERLWPDKSTHLRTYKEYYGQRKCPEWSFYSNNYHRGKRCIFAGRHTRSEYCHSVVMCLGQEKRALPNTLKEEGRKAPQTTNKTGFSTVSQKKRNVPPMGSALVPPKITT